MPERIIGCVMLANVLLFMLHFAAFLILGMAVLAGGHLTLGLLELGFAAMPLGCGCCRANSVRVRGDVDRKDALEIALERFELSES